MTIQKAIEKAKERLKKKTICENFGQNEVRKIAEKYIDISSYTEEMNQRRKELSLFNDWCMDYNG